MRILPGTQLPQEMKALLLPAPEQPLAVTEMRTPLPSNGQVLVKIDSSPINPSDLSFLAGTYVTEKALPAVAGFEAGGEVVAAGDDYLSRRLLGKRVACFAPPDGDGTWAQFMRTRIRFVVPLQPGLDMEQGAMLLVNPLTVVAMMDIARQGNHLAVANNAAAGALGQLLNRMCLHAGLPLVNIVRREDQAVLLRAQGASHVLVEDRDDFGDRLKELCRELRVTLAFDAVAGETTAKLVRAMPKGSEVMVYGGLSREPCQVNPGELIFRGKKVTGFLLTPWLARQSMLKLMRVFRTVQRFLKDHHAVRIQKRVPLSAVNDAVEQYQENMTAGKILVKPWG